MNQTQRLCTVPLALAAVLLGAGLVQPASACQTPVFRYALERWRADAYDVLVLHRGPLSDDQQALVESLDEAVNDPARMVNLFVNVIDLDKDPPKPVAELASRYADQQLPLIIVRYPLHADVPDEVAWVAPLSAGSIASLVDSPARREVAKRILAGHSAVWVLLETGDAAKNNAAAKLLESELKKMQEELQLPVPDPNTFAEDFRDDIKVKLKLEFSLIRVKPDDPAEAFFVSSLLKSEKDLTDLSKTEPMTFAVFGRGRALWALVGKGITGDNVYEACAFLAGACSCQVKELNPGIDMVMAVPWEESIIGQVIQPKPLPELTGLSSLEPVASAAPVTPTAPVSPVAATTPHAATAPAAVTPTSAPAPSAPVATPTVAVADSETGGDAVKRNLLILIGIGVLVVAGATVAMKRKAAA